MQSVNRSQQAMRECSSGLPTWRPGLLAKGTAAMTAAMGLRTLVQAFIFLIVARLLSIADYGAYSAILAISGTLGCFSGWGTHVAMVRNVSRNPIRFTAEWGMTLTAIVISAPILLSIYIPLAMGLLPSDVSFTAVALIGLGDLVFAPVGQAAITAYQSHDRMGRAAYLSLMPVLPRLVGGIALIPLVSVFPARWHLITWASLYTISALAGSVYAWWIVHIELGAPLRPSRSDLLNALRGGGAFAFGSAATKIYADIDKTMLARLTTLEAAGAYSAGYRFAEFATVPVLSLISAAMPRWFRAGENGMAGAIECVRRIIIIPFVYCSLAGLCLYFCADILPFMLGAAYGDAVLALQWLAFLPIASMPRLLLQSLLIGANRQNCAVKILAGGSLINILLNIWLIPLWNWQGAVAATYAAEFAMALSMCAAALLFKAKTQPAFHGDCG